jgi:hypothetical protein
MNLTAAEDMCEEYVAEIARIERESGRIRRELQHEITRRDELIAAMCAGRMSPQCPNCASHRCAGWINAGICVAASIVMFLVGRGVL